MLAMSSTYQRDNITNNSLVIITAENTTNNLYIFCKYHDRSLDSDSSRLFHKMTILIPGMFGILANLFVIVLAVKYTARKNLHHLIVNMAVSDTIVIGLHSTFELLLYSDIVFHIYIVFILEFAYLTAISASAVTLFIISLERFKATWYMTRRTRNYSLKRILAVIAATWVSSISISVFRPIFGSKESVIELYFSCVFAAFIVVLFLSILILSSLTLHTLSRLQNVGNQLYNPEARPVGLKRIRDAVRMVQCNLLLYSICFLPYICLNTLSTLNGLELIGDFENDFCIDWPMVYFIISSMLPVINCSLSPFVYFLCLPQFREAVYRVLWCRNRQSANQNNAHN